MSGYIAVKRECYDYRPNWTPLSPITIIYVARIFSLMRVIILFNQPMIYITILMTL